MSIVWPLVKVRGRHVTCRSMTWRQRPNHTEVKTTTSIETIFKSLKVNITCSGHSIWSVSKTGRFISKPPSFSNFQNQTTHNQIRWILNRTPCTCICLDSPCTMYLFNGWCVLAICTAILFSYVNFGTAWSKLYWLRPWTHNQGSWVRFPSLARLFATLGKLLYFDCFSLPRSNLVSSAAGRHPSMDQHPIHGE